jgi:hypothetical protein
MIARHVSAAFTCWRLGEPSPWRSSIKRAVCLNGRRMGCKRGGAGRDVRLSPLVPSRSFRFTVDR